MSVLPEVKRIDVRGKTITTYIANEISAAFREMGVGERVDVITDAFPAIEADLRTWCDITGHRLVDTHTGGMTWRFSIEKGHERRTGRKLAVVVSDDGLFELLSPLGFALAAALEGDDVSIYVQGPAVKVLTRGYVAPVHGVARPFGRIPRAGLAHAGHVSPQTKIEQVHRLGGRIFVCGPSMEHYKVERSDLVVDDVVVCEYLTFMAELNSATTVITS